MSCHWCHCSSMNFNYFQTSKTFQFFHFFKGCTGSWIGDIFHGTSTLLLIAVERGRTTPKKTWNDQKGIQSGFGIQTIWVTSLSQENDDPSRRLFWRNLGPIPQKWALCCVFSFTLTKSQVRMLFLKLLSSALIFVFHSGFPRTNHIGKLFSCTWLMNQTKKFNWCLNFPNYGCGNV